MLIHAVDESAVQIEYQRWHPQLLARNSGGPRTLAHGVRFPCWNTLPARSRVPALSLHVFRSVSYAAFVLGTLAPFFRASESPRAIACLRLFTVPPFPPLPDFNVPRFLRRMALSTRLLAACPYLRPDFREPFFLAGIEILLQFSDEIV